MSAIVQMICGPECPGCITEACPIASDDFNRADNTDIDTGSSAGWTEVSGAWAIASNKLQCTSAGIAACDTSHPDGDPQIHVAVTTRRTSNGTSSILLDYVDSTHYYEARFTIGASSRVGLYRANGGAPVLLSGQVSVTMNTNTDIAIAACIGSEGVFTAYVGGTARVSLYAAPPTGDQAGLAGNGGTGGSTFDNFVMTKAGGSCTACAIVRTCDNCDGPTPFAFLVEISGFVNNINCASCEVFNGFWYVPHITIFNCYYAYLHVHGGLCNQYLMILEITGGGKVRFRFTSPDSSFTLATHEYDMGAGPPYDCEIVDEEAAYVSHEAGLACYADIPTIRITSLT